MGDCQEKAHCCGAVTERLPSSCPLITHRSCRLTVLPPSFSRTQLQTPAGGTPFSRRPAKLVSNAALNGHLEALAPVADKMARKSHPADRHATD